MSTRIQLRRGTAAQWASANPVLLAGEEGLETDTGKVKIGDGATAWAALKYRWPFDPSSVAITGGVIAIPRWPFRRFFANRRPTTVHPVPPTITYSATTPTGVRPMLPSPQNVQTLGVGKQALNSTFGYMEGGGGNGLAGFEAEFTGDVLSYGWKCGVSTRERVMVYVDGLPCMSAAATPSVSTVAGSFYFVTLTFASVATRKVEVLLSDASAQIGVYIPLTGAIAPTPRKPTVLLVGDSFIGGSAAITDDSKLPDFQLAQTFDINVIRSGLGGTGYVAAGSFVPFGDSTRVTSTSCDPDKVIFLGSVNDDAASGVQAAASACFAAYKAAAPNAQFYAFGPQPSNSTDTISAARSSNIAAVKAAADAQGVTFFDMCGTLSGIPATFSTGTSYNFGDVVTYRGSVWRCANTATTSYPSGPAASSRWELLTFDLYGTGKIGSPAADGPRDTFLYSDGVHPTETGCGALAQRLATVLTT